MSLERHLPANPAGFMELVRGTQYEAVFRNEKEADRLIVKLLAESSNPLHREIGEGLSQRNLTCAELAGNSAYQEFVHSGFASLRHLDIGAIVDELANEKEQAVAGSSSQSDVGDDDDDIWQGFSERR
jgi:hypothetical protein